MSEFSELNSIWFEHWLSIFIVHSAAHTISTHINVFAVSHPFFWPVCDVYIHLFVQRLVYAALKWLRLVFVIVSA